MLTLMQTLYSLSKPDVSFFFMFRGQSPLMGSASTGRRVFLHVASVRKAEVVAAVRVTSAQHSLCSTPSPVSKSCDHCLEAEEVNRNSSLSLGSPCMQD